MSATLLKISRTITSDDFYGLPWPPPDSNVVWAVVRRANGRTLWRALQIAQSDRCHGLCNSAEAATATEEALMIRDEVFPSRYLKAADLKGKPRIVTIERAPYETLKGLEGKENQKIVLYFENVAKSLPLNATNFDAVCDATGFPDTEDWPGQRIELYPTRTSMGGKTVDCIRIRTPSTSRPAAAAPSPPPPSKPVDEMNDEIPW